MLTAIFFLCLASVLLQTAWMTIITIGVIIDEKEKKNDKRKNSNKQLRETDKETTKTDEQDVKHQ